MKFIVFYLEFINSLEGPGMFFSSAAIIRRLRRYAATYSDGKNGFRYFFPVDLREKLSYFFNMSAEVSAVFIPVSHRYHSSLDDSFGPP